MGFLHSSKQKPKTIALFDIGSDSVGGAIVHISNDPEDLPTIVRSVRVAINPRDHQLDFELFIADMCSALRATAQSLYREKLGAIESVYCTLASPWHLTETHVLKMSREHPFTFTNRLADELFQKEVGVLTEAYKKKYTDSGSAVIIERRILTISLDGGTSLDEPIGKQCRSIDMNMAVTLAPKLCLDDIRSAIEQSFPHVPIVSSSFTVASYLAVRDKYPTIDSYFLLDIGGEVTDVSIVSGGVLKDSVSFPFGSRTLFKQLKESLFIELRDAQELFNLYISGFLEESRRQKFEKALFAIENTWKISFRECITTLPDTASAPTTVFLTTDLSLQSWFTNILRNENNPLTPAGHLTVVTIDGPEFFDMCSVRGGSCDPFLMVETIALKRKHSF
jgi:hypothetical protein